MHGLSTEKENYDYIVKIASVISYYNVILSPQSYVIIRIHFNHQNTVPAIIGYAIFDNRLTLSIQRPFHFGILWIGILPMLQIPFAFAVCYQRTRFDSSRKRGPGNNLVKRSAMFVSPSSLAKRIDPAAIASLALW